MRFISWAVWQPRATTALMKVLAVLAVVSVTAAQIPLRNRHLSGLNSLNVANTGAYSAAQNFPPIPYDFSYSSDDVEGSHSAQQSGDGNGRVQGSYTISLADGRQRIVNYVADENGYRAEVSTNELGTESGNPTDVTISSSSITGEQAAIQYGPQAPERQIATARPTAQINSRVALPSYGTFAGANSARG